MKRTIALTFLAVVSMVLLGACASGTDAAFPRQSKSPSGQATSSGAPAPEAAATNGYPNHIPGAQDVSTMVRGQPFIATPNFMYFAKCGRPCWLPLYPTPQLNGSDKVTDNFPYERFAGNPGNSIKVVCQVKGDVLRDETGGSSSLWDKVIIPQGAQNVLKRSAFQTTTSLNPTPDSKGFYAYGADIWLGNTGEHGIPCS